MERCQKVAEHIAAGAEQLAFDMLMARACCAHGLSKTLGIGVLIASNELIRQAKEAVLKDTKILTISKDVPMMTRIKADPDEPCLN